MGQAFYREKTMKSFKQFIREAMLDPWIEAAKKMKGTHPDLQGHISNKRLSDAAHIYKNVLGQGGRNAVDTALRAHSHYHDIHGEFQAAVAKHGAAEPAKPAAGTV